MKNKTQLLYKNVHKEVKSEPQQENYSDSMRWEGMDCL